MVPPVPIPNTEVKRLSADDTAPARMWENRSLPEGLFFDMASHHVGLITPPSFTIQIFVEYLRVYLGVILGIGVRNAISAHKERK